MNPIEYLGDHNHYGHTVVGALTSFKPGWPFLFLFVFMIFSRIFDYSGLIERLQHSSAIKKYLKQKPKSESFYQIISKSDKLWLLAEERFLKKQYGIERIEKRI